MGFFEKLGEGLRKTRDSIFGSIAGLVNAGEITDELYDDLEEQLILADTGADVAMRLVEELRADYVLLARSDMASFVDSLVAPLSVINALIVAVGMSRRGEIEQTFNRLERIWEEYDVYEKPEDDAN